MNELYIGGAWVPSASGATSQTLNPFDASVLATVAEASAADVGRAVAAAREAFDSGPWPRTPAASRGKALARTTRVNTASPIAPRKRRWAVAAARFWERLRRRQPA